jgi:hypothetical protein
MQAFTPKSTAKEINFASSVNRPAWTQNDWDAYKHKHIFGSVIKDYYVKSKGKY